MKMIDLYLQAWNGDYSQVKSTFDPSAQIYMDRFPTGNASISYSVQPRKEIPGFMQDARKGAGPQVRVSTLEADGWRWVHPSCALEDERRDRSAFQASPRKICPLPIIFKIWLLF